MGRQRELRLRVRLYSRPDSVGAAPGLKKSNRIVKSAAREVRRSFCFGADFLRELVHLDEPQMNGGKLRHKDKQFWVRNSADNADSIGVTCIAWDFLCARNTSFAASHRFTYRKSESTRKRHKTGAMYLQGAQRWGWALRIEKHHVGDREGRTGRRIAELRLLDCFGAREFQHRTMAEGRGLLPVQRRREFRRHGAMDRRMRRRLRRWIGHRHLHP